jgi:hypothetical protein
VPRYQDYINSLKNQRCTIVGYARKSPGYEDETKRIEVLNRMVQCLRGRSLSEKVFVSPSCLAADTLTSRDLNEQANLLDKLTGVDGSTQGITYYICVLKTILILNFFLRYDILH